jgi:uncharacterized protein YjiS (DUF1127 family)
MTTRSVSAIWFRAISPARLLRKIRHLSDIAQSRRALQRLDEHLLRDIGLTRHQAWSEASRTPWDAPSHWRG